MLFSWFFPASGQRDHVMITFYHLSTEVESPCFCSCFYMTRTRAENGKRLTQTYRSASITCEVSSCIGFEFVLFPGLRSGHLYEAIARATFREFLADFARERSMYNLRCPSAESRRERTTSIPFKMLVSFGS